MFIQKFADLGNTHQDSDIEQIKVLLCSIFDSELTWDYSSFSNSKISKIYQYIFDFESVDVSFGDPKGICFELEYPIEFEIWWGGCWISI